jgi:hypothetical protein
MVTLEDCIGLCGLTEEEVLAVAEHEHLPQIAATAFAQYLLSRDHGSVVIRDSRKPHFNSGKHCKLSVMWSGRSSRSNRIRWQRATCCYYRISRTLRPTTSAVPCC